MDINITITDFISILSLILATFSFVISYFLWKEDRPRLKIKYFIWWIISSWIWKTHDVLNITVSNVWKRPVTISKQVALKLSKRDLLMIFYDEVNYIWYNWKQNEKINEFSSIDIIIDIKTFRNNKVKLDDVKWFLIWDTLGNNYFTKISKKDKEEIKKLIS